MTAQQTATTDRADKLVALTERQRLYALLRLRWTGPDAVEKAIAGAAVEA